METALLCLANSKKTGGRCLAGIEVTVDEKWVKFHFIENRPKWIRPVSHTKHGELTNYIAGHVKALDVITIDIVEPCPQNAQRENVFFIPEIFQVNCCINPKPENLDLLCSNVSPLFGNASNCVSERGLAALDHSLTFIKVDNFSYYVTKGFTGADQFRATFSHQNHNYDFPITDLRFIENDIQNVEQQKEIQAYLTLSLGEIFRGNCYKLIAGVIIL